MAIYHFSAQVISRGSGKSSVAAAAYRSGEKLEDKRLGITHDFTRKKNIDYTEILAPTHAPEWVKDRNTLWNEVEKVEKSKNSQLAREINVAIPKELSKEQQIELIRNFTQDQFVNKGMVADIALHHLTGKNPHAHIMLTIRPFNEDKTWGAKSQKEYILDKNGEKIKLPSGEYKSRKIETMDWNKKETFENWREEWAKHANKALEKAGSLERIDHRSLEEQGVDRIPQIHVGPHATAMEKRGELTDRGEQNRKIIDLNEFRERHRKQVRELKEDIKEFNAELIELKKIRDQKKEQSQLPKPELQQPDLNERLEDARQAVNQSYEEMARQKQSVASLNSEIDRLKYKLHDLDVTENFLQITEEKLKAIKFNPFKRAEIKELQKSIDRYKGQIEITLGGDSRESLVQQLRKKEKEIPKEERKLAEAETRFTRSRHNFDDLSKKKKKPQHDKNEELQAKKNLTVDEWKQAISQAKESGIKTKDHPKTPKIKSKGWDQPEL